MNSRIYRFDFLKIIACYFIIIIHTTGWLYQERFSGDLNIGWMATLFQQCITRFAVPCYMFITGAFALRKDNANWRYSKKKVLTYLFILVIWSIIYIFIDGDSLEKKSELLVKMPFHHIRNPLWYLYFIIKIYILAPFLIILYEKMNEKQKKMFILICLMLPSWLDFILRLLSFENSTYLASQVLNVGWNRVGIPEIGMVVLGKYLVDKYVEEDRVIKPYRIAFMVIISLGLLMVSACRTSIITGVPDFAFFDHLRFPTIFYGIGVFLLFVSLNKLESLGARTDKIIRLLSDSTIYIYVSHELIIEILKKYNITISAVFFEKHPSVISTFLDGGIFFLASSFLGIVIVLVKKSVKSEFGGRA